MQDLVTEAVCSGFDFDWVIDLDLLSFDALVASIHRTKYREMLLTINAARIAQADTKDFKSAVKSIEKESSISAADPDPHACREMSRKLGKGF